MTCWNVSLLRPSRALSPSWFHERRSYALRRRPYNLCAVSQLPSSHSSSARGAAVQATAVSSAHLEATAAHAPVKSSVVVLPSLQRNSDRFVRQLEKTWEKEFLTPSSPPGLEQQPGQQRDQQAAEDLQDLEATLKELEMFTDSFVSQAEQFNAVAVSFVCQTFAL